MNKSLNKVTKQMIKNGVELPYREIKDFQKEEPRWANDPLPTANPRRPRKYLAAGVVPVVLLGAFTFAGTSNAEGSGDPICVGTSHKVTQGDTVSGLMKEAGLDWHNNVDVWTWAQLNPHLQNPNNIWIDAIVCLNNIPTVQQFDAPLEEVSTPVDFLLAITSEKHGWPAERQQAAMRYLLEAGYSVRGAAWMVGSYIQESGHEMETAVNEPEGSHGLAQWRRGRLRADFPYNDFQGQLAYTVNELLTSYKKSDKILRNPSASDKELDKAIKLYEGYGHKGKRTQFAKQILKELS